MAIQSTDAKVSVYIGRFNPFHNGHAHVLTRALETSKLVIVLLGSAGLARSLKNPFIFNERQAIIQKWYSNEVASGRLSADTKLVIAPLRDYPYNDALWIREVQSTINGILVDTGMFGNSTVHLTGSDRDDSTWYLRAFPQWKLDLVSPYRHGGTGDLNATGDLRATRIRELLFDTARVSADAAADMIGMLPTTTYDYLCDFMGTPEHTRLVSWYRQNKAYKEAWSVAPYAPIFTTVDAVVVQSGHILVVVRGAEPGKGLWALPGGFLNQNERLSDAVIRELIEETGISLAEGKKAKDITIEILKGSIREKEVFDAPDRSMRGRTITHAFFIRLDDTKPLPFVKGQNAPLEETGGVVEVETAKAFWLPIDEALNRSDMWFEDHHSIIETLIGTKDL